MDSKTNSGDALEVAALGRPFNLGMLYDCRKDTLIPGLTLWDHKDLTEDVGERLQSYSDFTVEASDSSESKYSALNVNASLKASLFSGAVEIEGSAKYLNDTKTSKNQTSVTLNYKVTTKVRELSMNHLGRGNVRYPDVFDKGLATHVVTAIVYGAQAVFVFKSEVSEKEDHKDIQGKLKVSIEKIPTCKIEGKGEVKIDESDKANTKRFSCKFYGDFCIQTPPTTFQDAIWVYQSLPKLLGPNGENAIPMKVWLLPLTSIDSSAAKLVRQISVGLVQDCQRVLEDFNEIDMRCNAAMTMTAAKQFPQIVKKFNNFKEMCSEFKLKFQQSLAKNLPSIRGGGEEESELAEILWKIHSSPFNRRNMNEWMESKESEIHTLRCFTKMMKNTAIIPSQNKLYEELLNADHVVCFVFTSLGRAEPYLSALSDYLKGTTKPDDPQDPHTDYVEKEPWYASAEIAEMKKKAKLFNDFAETNKGKNIKFLTVGLRKDTRKGSTIYLYKDGFCVDENFEPPETLTVGEINHNSVTLKISPPRFGEENVTSYSVEYCVSGEDGRQQTIESKTEEVTVSDLRPNTEYKFRCRAVTLAGVWPVSAVSDSIKTLPCCPPGEPQVEANSCKISVSWKKPAELGQDVQISRYILECAKTDNEVKEELDWTQTRARRETGIISRLQSETKYAVRVRCDCGEAGTSKESITVYVRTPRPTLERLRRESERIGFESPSVYQLPLKEEEMNIDGCRKFNFGRESLRRNRTIVLLGATGSGKSTLINGMINYLVGVEWKDDFRFKLINEVQLRSEGHSQTSEITVYKINHQEGFKIDYSLTIVDTPGFGDTRGIKRDELITEQLCTLFSTEDGVREVDAVCFVAPAASTELTEAQKYVFDSVLSIFGKDVAENIQVLVTFADDELLPVLEVISASDTPCPETTNGLPVHFIFNNEALFAHNQAASTDDDQFDENFEEFWTMGTNSMEWFFAGLNVMHTKSLILTTELLRERHQLQNVVESFKRQIKLGLAELDELKETAEKLRDHEAEVSRNENFEFEVTVMRPFKESISTTEHFATNCPQCHVTCHYPCSVPTDARKKMCAAMGSDGSCMMCPRKCNGKVHSKERFRWEHKQVKEKQTVKELRQKYKGAPGKKITVQGLSEKLKEEYGRVQTEVVKVMQSSTKCLNRLQEIALKPNPVSAPDNIDLLIQGEKSEDKQGGKKRVQHFNY